MVHIQFNGDGKVGSGLSLLARAATKAVTSGNFFGSLREMAEEAAAQYSQAIADQYGTQKELTIRDYKVTHLPVFIFPLIGFSLVAFGLWSYFTRGLSNNLFLVMFGFLFGGLPLIQALQYRKEMRRIIQAGDQTEFTVEKQFSRTQTTGSGDDRRTETLYVLICTFAGEKYFSHITKSLSRSLTVGQTVPAFRDPKDAHSLVVAPPAGHAAITPTATETPASLPESFQGS